MPRSPNRFRASVALALAATVAAAIPSAGAAATLLLPRPATAGPIDHPPIAAAGFTYYYAEAFQSFASGAYRSRLAATFTVHHPGQVVNSPKRADHSLAEIAVRAPNLKFTFVEAGWMQAGTKTKPQLFVYWWRHGNGQCYNFGCGFVRAGHGLRPGRPLNPGARIRLSWSHHNHKWWLAVNGKTSGYYPDKLWNGDFTQAEGVQLFGEVAVKRGVRGCDDMGNGRWPGNPKSAKVFDVSYNRGTVDLRKGTVTAPKRYRLTLTGNRSFRYGGPSIC
jgi:hypothetical protein